MTLPTTKLEWAGKHAADGYCLIPLVEDSKIPAIKDWRNRASRDDAQVVEWFASGRHNIGAITEKFGDNEALIVVDIDRKNGVDGAETIRRLEIEGFDFPDTVEHVTPSGGAHVIYRSPYSVKQGAGVLGPGVDIRSHGGFIVMPGSTIDGKPYTVAE